MKSQNILTIMHVFNLLCSVGIHQRPGDLEVNVCKQKALTNMRSATKGITVGLSGSIELSLDESVEYLAPDEIMEVCYILFHL